MEETDIKNTGIGNRAAKEKLLGAHLNAVRQLAVSYLLDRERTELAVKRTFRRAFSALDDGQDELSVALQLHGFTLDEVLRLKAEEPAPAVELYYGAAAPYAPPYPPYMSYAPYAQPPYTQTPYAQAPYTTMPYAQMPYTQTPYPQAPYAQIPYTQSPYSPPYAAYGQTSVNDDVAQAARKANMEHTAAVKAAEEKAAAQRAEQASQAAKAAAEKAAQAAAAAKAAEERAAKERAMAKRVAEERKQAEEAASSFGAAKVVELESADAPEAARLSNAMAEEAARKEKADKQAEQEAAKKAEAEAEERADAALGPAPYEGPSDEAPVYETHEPTLTPEMEKKRRKRARNARMILAVNIVGALLMIWVLLGLLRRIGVFPGLDLGYSAFNEAVFKMF